MAATPAEAIQAQARVYIGAMPVQVHFSHFVTALKQPLVTAIAKEKVVLRCSTDVAGKLKALVGAALKINEDATLGTASMGATALRW